MTLNPCAFNQARQEMSCVLPSCGVAIFFPRKSAAVLIGESCFTTSAAPRIGRARDDANFCAVRFEVRIQGGSLADVGKIERAGEDRLHRGWSGVVSEPLNLHIRPEPLLEPAFALPRERMRDHALRVSDVRKMSETSDLFSLRPMQCAKAENENRSDD